MMVLTHMEDVGGTHAVGALKTQGQVGGGQTVRAGFRDLTVIALAPQLLKPGFGRFKGIKVFQRRAVLSVVRPGFQVGDDVNAPSNLVRSSKSLILLGVAVIERQPPLTFSKKTVCWPAASTPLLGFDTFFRTIRR